MNKALTLVLVIIGVAVLVCAWNRTSERNQCRAELYAVEHITPSSTPTPPAISAEFAACRDLSALSPDGLSLCLGVNYTNGDYAPLQVDAQGKVYARCILPADVVALERQRIAVFNCKCED